MDLVPSAQNAVKLVTDTPTSDTPTPSSSGPEIVSLLPPNNPVTSVFPTHHPPMVEDVSSACESGTSCGSHVDGVGDNLPESDDVTRPDEPETPDPRGDQVETSTHSPETDAH